MASIALDTSLETLTLTGDRIKLDGFLSKQGAANFLNIQFATVPRRFATAKLVALSELSSPRTDVHQYGPRCPQKADTVHILMGNMFEKLSSPHQFADETECLNLNIYTRPTSLTVSAKSKLSVFVWIHGGAFNSGDNTYQFGYAVNPLVMFALILILLLDGNHLVKRSLILGMPIVLVVINYRLNILGFLSSRELKEEAISQSETYVANQGLNDQRIALQWVQSSIHRFGGDPMKVTLCGESAGGLSILCHLQGGLPLFQQAIIQSAPVLPLRSMEDAQAGFDKLVAAAGISSEASGTEKLAALRALTSEQLIEIFDGSFSFPIEDPLWYRGTDLKQANLSIFWGRLPSWCRRVVFGNT